ACQSLSSPPWAQVGTPPRRPLVTPWDNLIRHATGQWLTKTDSRVQTFPREVCRTRDKMLWESSFLATFRLMLHIKNRDQPIRAPYPQRRAAIAQDSGTQCLTKRVNVGLKATVRERCERPAVSAAKKPKTNVVSLGFHPIGRRSPVCGAQAGQPACKGVSR